MNSIVLNGKPIKMRDSDNFVNATQLCKAGGKKVYEWKKLKITKKLIKKMIKQNGFANINQVIDTKHGGVSKKQRTWVHPGLVDSLIEWIKPRVVVIISGLIHSMRESTALPEIIKFDTANTFPNGDICGELYELFDTNN